jgi:hypothetical protein
MPPRYSVRRPAGDSRYSVWDNLQGGIALADNREWADLGFAEAFDTADRLNGQEDRPTEKQSASVWLEL